MWHWNLRLRYPFLLTPQPGHRLYRCAPVAVVEAYGQPFAASRASPTPFITDSSLEVVLVGGWRLPWPGMRFSVHSVPVHLAHGNTLRAWVIRLSRSPLCQEVNHGLWVSLPARSLGRSNITDGVGFRLARACSNQPQRRRGAASITNIDSSTT